MTDKRIKTGQEQMGDKNLHSMSFRATAERILISEFLCTPSFADLQNCSEKEHPVNKRFDSMPNFSSDFHMKISLTEIEFTGVNQSKEKAKSVRVVKRNSFEAVMNERSTT